MKMAILYECEARVLLNIRTVIFTYMSNEGHFTFIIYYVV